MDFLHIGSAQSSSAMVKKMHRRHALSEQPDNSLDSVQADDAGHFQTILPEIPQTSHKISNSFFIET